MHDAYMWLITRADGTSIQEFDEARPDGRGWAEIGREPVKEVYLVTPDISLIHHVLVPSGATPVFFRRRTVTINPTSGQEEDRSTAHCIGWKQGEDATYLFVFDSGETLLTNDFKAV